jgi:hypothetical protein
MGDMEERREVVYGLPGDELRECMVRVEKEMQEHHAGVHSDDPLPWDESVTRELPSYESRRREVKEVLRTLGVKPEEGAHEQPLQKVDKLLKGARAVGFSDRQIHGLLLDTLELVDEHWRMKHAEESEPGIEYIRRVVTEVRQHSR